MKIICAPDSFKGSINATRAAEAMAAGIQKTVPDASIDCCPVADGGEGTLAVLCAAMPGKLHRAAVSGPLGAPLECRFGTFLKDTLAVVESAAAVGLDLVPPELREPMKMSSRGVGELITGACTMNPDRIVVAVGGSASNDGGCGMAQALGIRFFDRDGDEVREPMCGGMLSDLSRIDDTGRLTALRSMEIIAACDVQNVLTGPDGAAHVYGPQKGASGEQVALLDAGLRHLAGLIRRDLDIDVEALPGSGAGGGLGAGLVAFAGATVASGIDIVLDGVNFETRVHGTDLCLTGEGRIDAQSLSGKACMGVARVAGEHNVPTVALVGTVGHGADRCLDAGLAEYVLIGEGLPADVSMRQADMLIAEAAGRIARRYLRYNAEQGI